MRPQQGHAICSTLWRGGGYRKLFFNFCFSNSSENSNLKEIEMLTS